MAQTINVDSKPALFMPTLYYSQGDVGRTFEIVVSSSDGFTIPSGATCQMVATKPSGLGFTVAGTVSGNKVTFTTTAVMTDEWGRFPAELRITSGNTVIGTANFYMEGERNPHPDGTTDGSQETLIPELTLLVERAENAAQTATDDAIEAASATIDEVLNYLPTEVTNLKSDLSNLKSLGREVVRPTLVQGYYSTQGEFISRTDKKSYCSPSDEFIDSTYITQLVVASGFDCQVFYYDSAKQFETWEHNYSGTYSISHDGYIKVVAVKGSWTVYELSEAYASFTLYRTNTIVDAIKASTLYRAIDSIGAEMFSKGGLLQGKDDTWMSDSRMRTPILYALNDIYVEAKVASYPNACFSIQTIDNEGNFISDTGWKSSFKITKGTAFRMLCTLDASSSAVKSVSEIYAGFAWLPNLATVKDLLAYDSILSWFEHGGINNNNGNNDTWYGNARGRFVNIMSFPFDVLIHRKSGAYAIAFYDDNDSFVGQLGWIEADRMISANTKFRMMVTPNQNVSTYYSLEDVVACIDLEEIPTKQYGLNPNIIWQSRNVDDSMYPPYSKWYIQAAAKNQYDRVRFNVRKTTDGYYFLCHDDTINTEARNTDGSTISSSISATGRTLAELNSYDWGIKYGAIYEGASVPLLDDALKYSALYNLGVSIEFSSLSGWTDTDTANVLAMCDKYGITDNLIVIDPAGLDIPFLQKFIAHNKRISLYVGAVSSWWTDTNVARVNSLLTEYNNVYVQLYPWGTMPTTEFINLAKANDWKLYSSTAMTKSALLTEDMFNKGLSLIETNNVYMVKNTVRDWVDGLLKF